MKKYQVTVLCAVFASALFLSGCEDVYTRAPFGDAVSSETGANKDMREFLTSLTGEWETPGLPSDSDLRPVADLRMNRDGSGTMTVTQFKKGRTEVGHFEVRITSLLGSKSVTKNGIGHEPFLLFLREKPKPGAPAAKPDWRVLWVSFPLNGVVEKDGGGPKIAIVTAPSSSEQWDRLGFVVKDPGDHKGGTLRESPEKIVARLIERDPRLLMATGTTGVFVLKPPASK